MPLITCIEDLRLVARRRVPRMFYDYVDSGSWTESTYRANERDLAAISFRQRVAADIENRSAPTGLCGMQHADGEILAARAAEAFGVPFCLSTMSICSIEDVATNTTKPFWFQLYVMRNRDFVERLIGRAKQAQCSALVVTLDLPLAGQRHKVLRNGLSVPPRLTIANLINMVMKPKWCLEMLRARRRIFGNLVGHVNGVSDMTSLVAWTEQQFDPRFKPKYSVLQLKGWVPAGLCQ
jgi:L-lactate dehydrogenase (cytochrome)